MNLLQSSLAVFAFTLLVCGPAQAADGLNLSEAQANGTVTSLSPAGLKVVFGTTESWPNVTWKAPDGGQWDWSKSAALVLELSNPTKREVHFHVKIDDQSADGKEHSTTVSGAIGADKSQTCYVSLEPRSKRQGSGMRSLPSSPAMTAFGECLGSGVEPSHVKAVQIFLAMPKQEATLVVKSISPKGTAVAIDLTKLVDKYGQYTRADWPGKIHSDADFAAQLTGEDADLKSHPAPKDRDKWGGWASGPKQAATGFFHTANVGGKWWLVDPDGSLFLSMGVDVVRPDLSTTVGGRENMFEWIPDAADPLASCLSSPTPTSKANLNFLRANRIRKYGGNDPQAFADRAVTRLSSWGFNTLGNWSIESIGQERHFPYVAALAIKANVPTVPTGMRLGGGKMADPFDPAFAANVDELVKAKSATVKDDPACIGYFFDNELSWGMPDVDGEHFGLCYAVLGLRAATPAKHAFVEMLQKRYDSIEKLNAAWGTVAASWDEVSSPFRAPAPIATNAQRADFSDYLTLFADKYFSTVRDTIKRNDPNHMYLGCRFAYWFTPEAVKSCAKYSDVISFNIYTWNRDAYLFAENLGKPCIVGEFHFGAADRGMFSGDITVKDQKDRADHYRDYVASILAEPAFVGCHWFQYFDEPTTGRSGDGENFNIGYLSITDTPYPELIAATRSTNARAYQLHANPAAGPARTGK